MPENTRVCHLRSNMGDWLVDTLLPRLVSPSPSAASALGARRQDIIVLNFAVWINWAQARPALGCSKPCPVPGFRVRHARRQDIVALNFAVWINWALARSPLGCPPSGRGHVMLKVAMETDHAQACKRVQAHTAALGPCCPPG